MKHDDERVVEKAEGEALSDKYDLAFYEVTIEDSQSVHECVHNVTLDAFSAITYKRPKTKRQTCTIN